MGKWQKRTFAEVNSFRELLPFYLTHLEVFVI
jgi:hypothetical protein